MQNKKTIKNIIKNDKGITMIALILTIIIALILAAASMKFIVDGHWVKSAKDAISETQKSQKKEDEEMDETLNILEKK